MGHTPRVMKAAPATERSRVPRSDAQANRERIVAAARLAYAEVGFDVPLESIARRAGVGRATLYRNFPDRFALGAAIFDANIRALEALAHEHRERPDALTTLLRAIVAQQVEGHALVPALLMSPSGPDLHALSERVSRLFTAPLARARQARLVRQDLTVRDLLSVVAMVSAAVTGLSDESARRAGAERALELIGHGIFERAS